MLYTLKTCENGKCPAEIFSEQGPDTSQYIWLQFNPDVRCQFHDGDPEPLRLIPKHLVIDYDSQE